MLKVVLALFYIYSEVNGTLKVYINKKSKNNAELFCEAENGVLLGYSKELLDAAVYCNVKDVATNGPWLSEIGCFHAISTPMQQVFSDNHLANCAQFCSDDIYDFIGVQSGKCLCFDSLVGASPAGNCDSISCPGNPTENCGITHMIVYRKVKILTTSECQHVAFGSNMFQISNGNCSTPRSFVCKTGTIMKTECINDGAAEALAQSSSTNLGLILGVTIGLLAIIVLVLVLVYIRLKNRKRKTEDRWRMHKRHEPTAHISDDDFINAFRTSPSYHNSEVRTPDPVPLVPFDGDGISLDKSPIPVYTPVHKKTNENGLAKTNLSKADSQSTPTYDEVYQPSNKSNIRDNSLQNRNSFTTNNTSAKGPSSRTGSYEGSLSNINEQRRHSQNQNGVHDQTNNELQQNNMFRKNQTRHQSLPNDELY